MELERNLLSVLRETFVSPCKNAVEKPSISFIDLHIEVLVYWPGKQVKPSPGDTSRAQTS